MQQTRVNSVEEARRVVNERAVPHVKVGLFDLDGILRGKYISREKFLSALDGGFGFCDVVLGWDSDDKLVDNLSYTGWHTGYPDATARVLPETGRNLPYEDDGLFFLGELDRAGLLAATPARGAQGADPHQVVAARRAERPPVTRAWMWGFQFRSEPWV